MEGEARCEALTGFSRPSFGPGSRDSLEEAARIINGSQRAVILLGLLASKPGNADAVRAFMRKTNIPAVRTPGPAGTVSADLFHNFAGPRRSLDNSPRRRASCCGNVIALLLGYDPVEYDPSFWNHQPCCKLIHIDSNPRTGIKRFCCTGRQNARDISLQTSRRIIRIGRPCCPPAPDVNQFSRFHSFETLSPEFRKPLSANRGPDTSLAHRF